MTPRFFLIAFCALACVALTGCATTDDRENMSERPWNAPKNWEHGLPTSIMRER